jgi:hypothetical protein
MRAYIYKGRMTKYKYGSPNMEKEESRSKNGKKMRQFIVPFCSIMHRITMTFFAIYSTIL